MPKSLCHSEFVLWTKRAIGRGLGPIALLACILAVGCADTKGPTSRPMSFTEKQDEALKDPFGYGPKAGSGSDFPSVTGGGMGDFDKKSFNRDVDRVVNP